MEFHHATTHALTAAVLLGHRDLWELAEFQAFRDGFNLNLGDTSLFEVLLCDPLQGTIS